MAVSDTTEEPQVNLTHRLVGAAVLIAVAVIILPMLLAGEDEEQKSVTALETPVKIDDEEFVSKIKPREDTTNQGSAQTPAQQNQVKQNLQAMLDSGGSNARNPDPLPTDQSDQTANLQNTVAMDPDPAPTDDAPVTGAQGDTNSSVADSAVSTSSGAGSAS